MFLTDSKLILTDLELVLTLVMNLVLRLILKLVLNLVLKLVREARVVWGSLGWSELSWWS